MWLGRAVWTRFPPSRVPRNGIIAPPLPDPLRPALPKFLTHVLSLSLSLSRLLSSFPCQVYLPHPGHLCLRLLAVRRREPAVRHLRASGRQARERQPLRRRGGRLVQVHRPRGLRHRHHARRARELRGLQAAGEAPCQHSSFRFPLLSLNIVYFPRYIDAMRRVVAHQS